MTVTNARATTILPRARERARQRTTPRLARARRALIRFQAAQTTNAMLRDLLTIDQQPTRRRKPRFVRLDELTARYEALEGDPADLLR